ncbi:hypothetical protein [Sphingomonas montanisoli]|uniref:Uncharacterized protein n=1 Tax=Sphingomonas montanisoli TaxID=2606412 RepID=A0A5D9C7Q4_9SPHN|nr:hypothetical protein [Sphingomonas montanisoli]TZG27908.1 hypothetical protein FYJ91_10215 [Sphingomonas montanisoli]
MRKLWLAGGGALALAAGIASLAPVFAQGAPESLLPPGFGEAPAPRPVQPTAPTPGQPAPAAPGAATPAPVLALDPALFAPAPTPVAEALELPPSARRSTNRVGVIAGLGPDTFGTANGKYLAGIMRRLDMPLASRWASITVRRALISRVETPAGIDPADWIAERAWLLLRMGEADGARMMVQAVDVDRYNAKMYAVAAQTALATADPAGLCPLADGGALRSKETIWPMARAICAGLSGDGAIADVLMDQARRRTSDPRGIDVQLAEKVLGVNGSGARSVNIEWTGVNQLTSWRFGMASALGVTVPSDLMATVGPQVAAWQARNPMLPAADRIDAALIAARLGVFSNAALVDLYGQLADDGEELTADSKGGRLRACYVGDDDGARVAAMRWFWKGEGKEEGAAHDRFPQLILTARAAASVTPSEDFAGDVSDLVGAMMTAGLDRRAARWAPVVAGMSDEKADTAWAILATGSPEPVVDTRVARVDAYAARIEGSDPHKAKMLIAALAGLGRLGGEDAPKLFSDHGVTFDLTSNWAQLIRRAAFDRQPGTVALLVAMGMQRMEWRSVSPALFYTMLRSLREVGLDGEARMIAAEAMTRL